MRTVKEPEIRKNEILDAADTLFAQKGFDNTSTGDILEMVGIARGTLYYHFKSKEDILDALIDRYNRQILSAAQAAASDSSLSARERLIRTILALNVSQKGGQELKEQMHRPQNALMHQKTQMAVLNGVTPILTKLIREGAEAGHFQTPYPRGCVEMIMVYSNVFFDDATETSEELRDERTQALIFNIERLLGAETGSLTSDLMRVFSSRKVEQNEADN